MCIEDGVEGDVRVGAHIGTARDFECSDLMRIDKNPIGIAPQLCDYRGRVRFHEGVRGVRSKRNERPGVALKRCCEAVQTRHHCTELLVGRVAGAGPVVGLKLLDQLDLVRS